MSDDMRKFLGLMAVAAGAMFFVMHLMRNANPGARVGVGCMSAVGVIGAGFRFLFLRGSGGARRTMGDSSLPGSFVCRHCGHSFAKAEAGGGYAGSNVDFCLTCPGCGRWVADL